MLSPATKGADLRKWGELMGNYGKPDLAGMAWLSNAFTKPTMAPLLHRVGIGMFTYLTHSAMNVLS